MENKTFKEYFFENKKIYEFKIKVVGDLSDDDVSKIKQSLNKFNVESCSDKLRTPIQESQIDFPNQKNIEVSVIDIATAYPVTSMQITDAISEALHMPRGSIKVRNLKEQEEDELNHKYTQDNKTGESLLNSDYEKSNNQSIVGDKHVMSLLKELNKTKTTGTQYKGVNDKLLAKAPPKEKPQKPNKVDKSFGVFGKTENTDPRSGK